MRGEVVAGVVRVVVGQSHRKASEVNSDPTLPVYIAKHDTLYTAKVMVGFNLALWVLVRGLPRGLPSREIRRSPSRHHHTASQVVVVDIFANKCQG